MTLTYAWRLVTRNITRTVTYLFGLALAVGLFAGILFFVDATTGQMTASALAPVKLDIVAHATTISTTVDVTTMAAKIVKGRGILAAEPVSAADFSSAVKVGGTQISPAGRMFALTPGYFKTFDILQMSEGSFSPNGVSVNEAMAVALGLKVGDRLRFDFAGVSGPVELPVTGIISTANADALFAGANEAENTVVSDVVFVDSAWFRSALQASLAAYAANPPASLPAGSIILDPQIHVKIDRSLLPTDPTLAAIHTDAMRREVERTYPGQLKATDNLSRMFNAVKADVLSAKILFIFLGLPGVALAAYLSKFAAELFAEAQRRELSLLRTRGATTKQIGGIVAVSSVLLALGGSALGILVGVLALLVAAGGQVGSALNPFAAAFAWGAFANSALLAFAAGLVLTFLAAFMPTFGALRREIAQERRIVRRVETAPLWRRIYLDFICLGVAGIVLFVTQLNGGFKPTGNEGAAISLSFYIFLAPFCAWIGLTLLVLRLLDRGLSATGTQIALAYRGAFGDIGEVAGRSVSRRAKQISAATTVIALTLSFGVSLALFQQTYATEKRLDSQYIVGSDIRFTPALNSPQTAEFASKLKVQGVQNVTAVARDTQALVGSEKNTVYGIDVPSFRQAAYLPDSFFIDGSTQQTVDAMTNLTKNYTPGSASQVLDALARTPNGVIISVEQAEKYNIRLGDPVLLRLYNRLTKKYSDTQAQAVGFFIYFPTSSQDSDFILNRDFMTRTSGVTAIDYFLINAGGQPGNIGPVSVALTAQFKNVLPVRIQSTETVIKTDQSSLTSLNLGGLGSMERLYTILVTSLGLAIFLLAMVNERRREFGSMRALGANLKHLRRFLFAEAATIGGLSLVLGTAVGILLAYMLVMLLAVLFTIPANGLSWPGMELLLMLGLVVLGMALSTVLSARRLSRLRVVEALREL